MTELPQEQRRHQADDGGVLADLQQRAQRVGALRIERAPCFRRQRFRQDEAAEGEIQQRQGGGDEEGRAGTEGAEQAADGRPQDEPRPERRADEPEVLRASVGRADVGEVGIGGRVRRAGHAGDGPPGEQPDESGRDTHDQIIEAEREQREQDHRSASEAIAQVAEHRSAEELHHGVGEPQPAAVDRGPAQSLAGQLPDQLGHDGQDHAEPDGVDQHGHEDEDDGAPADRRRGHGVAAYVKSPGRTSGPMG